MSGLVQATRTVVERLKSMACQPRDEGEHSLYSVLSLCEDEHMNA